MTADMVHLGEICRLCILMVLLAAIAGKLRAPRPFLETIGNLTGTTDARKRLIAFLVIGAETFPALLLILGGEWTRPGLGVAAGLFLGFAAVILRLSGRSVACNCFGGSSMVISPADLARAAACFGLCVGGILLPSSGSAAAADLILRLGVACVLATMLIGLSEFVALVRE